jgi:hypothetical protein
LDKNIFWIKNFTYIDLFLFDKILKVPYYFCFIKGGINMAIYALPNLIRHPDCCALSERGKCTRLTLNNCLGESCTFKRNRKEDLDSLQCAHQRLSNLDISAQTHIANKYFGGSMPWKEEQTFKTSKRRRTK